MVGGGRGARLGERREGLVDEHLVDRDAHPLLRLDVVEHGLVARVAVVAQDEGLDGDLDTVGRPRLDGAGVIVFSWGAALVIDGRDGCALGFHEVDRGDQAVRFARQCDRAGMYPIVFREFISRD